MKVITYARFSSVGQKDGTSIERQVELAEAYAKAKGWSISEIITDEGKSAFHAAHKRKSGGLGRIFERVKSGDVGAGDVLIVESVDRLSREDVMTALDSFLELMTSGLTVVTTMDGRELNKSNYTSQWSDIIVLIAKMAAAHEESAKRSERGLDIWKRRRARAVLTCRHPAWFNEDGSINPYKAKVVREVFAMAINGHGTGSG